MDSIPTAVTWPGGKVLVAWLRGCGFGSHFSRSPSFSLQRLFSECWIPCLVFWRRCNFFYTVLPFITLNSILNVLYSIFLRLLSTVQTPFIFWNLSVRAKKKNEKHKDLHMGWITNSSITTACHQHPPPPPPPPPPHSHIHTFMPTLRVPFSGTFLQTLPDLVTPLKGHSLSPRSCPPTRSVPSERFGYRSDCGSKLAPKHAGKHKAPPPRVKKEREKKEEFRLD